MKGVHDIAVTELVALAVGLTDLSFNVSLEIVDDDITPSNMDGFVQNCSNSIVNAMEVLQPYTKPSLYS